MLQIDCGWEISCSTLWEFHTPNSMQLSEKRNGFSQFFVPLPEPASNFKHFQKKMIIKANVFPNLQTVKNCLKSAVLEHALTVNM